MAEPRPLRVNIAFDSRRLEEIALARKRVAEAHSDFQQALLALHDALADISDGFVAVQETPDD